MIKPQTNELSAAGPASSINRKKEREKAIAALDKAKALNRPVVFLKK